MSGIYTSGEYLAATGTTWHLEDSPWKAGQIAQLLIRNSVRPRHVVEVGCGAGRIIDNLSRRPEFCGASFRGYDLSPQAIAMCREIENTRCEYFNESVFASESRGYAVDLLLAIDVLEHVPAYLDFLAECKRFAQLKVYHIPLDIHVVSVVTNAMIGGRYSVGHLHYFTAESALATLRDTGHEILDYVYTNSALDLFSVHASPRRAMGNVGRWLMNRVSVPWAARVLGGYSLLVLGR